MINNLFYCLQIVFTIYLILIGLSFCSLLSVLLLFWINELLLFCLYQLFYQMKRKNSFKMDVLNLQSGRYIDKSEYKNRLRKSLDNFKNLRLELTKLRTSFSNTSLNCFETSTSHTRASTYVPTLKKNNNTQSNSSIKFNDKLAVLEEKIKTAKNTMKREEESIDAKTTRKMIQKTEQGRSKSKQLVLQTQRCGQQTSLAAYTAITTKPLNVRPFSRNPYTVRGNKYYISEAIRAINQKYSLAMQHISQSMQMLLQYKLFKINQQVFFDNDKIILPIKYKESHRKTLLLDLDQTLIHCFQNNQCTPDLRLTIKIDQNPFQIGFNIRPYAMSFLKKMKKNWEVIVFTASHQSYADTILDQIDPDNTLFDHRLYRQHCRQLTSQLYIKDLSKINRDLSQMVLVDNSAYSFAMQVDNGIPILPFYEGKDYELTALQSYLQKLLTCEDVRQVNREYFQLHNYTSFDNGYELVDELYRKRFN